MYNIFIYWESVGSVVIVILVINVFICFIFFVNIYFFLNYNEKKIMIKKNVILFIKFLFWNNF